MIKYVVECRSAARGETALDANSTATNPRDADAQANIWAQNMRIANWLGTRDWLPHVRVVNERQPWE